MKSRTSTAPSWNLSDIYTGINDPRLGRGLRRNARSVVRFERQHRGKVARAARSGKGLRTMLTEYESLLAALALPLSFAQLLFAASSSDPERRAFLQRMQAEYTARYGQLLFFELELLQLPDRELRAAARRPELARFANYLRKLRASKAHRLSEREEQIMNDKQLSGRKVLVRLYNEELALKKFELRLAGKRRSVSQTALLDMLSDPRPDRRKSAAHALTAGLKGEQRRLTLVFNTIVQDKSIDDRFRGFQSPESARHLANQIEPELVEIMAREVTRGYRIVQEYYRFKSQAMGRPLRHYDRYAPICQSRTRHSFPAARDLVLRAFGAFSGTARELAAEFFKRGWIDAAPRAGKRGGAFCASTIPELHPYILLSYSGSLRDVFTLAHELGHGIHGCLMREAGYINYDVPLTVCETASVFAEMLLFEELQRSVRKPRELFAIHAALVENVIATVFRQIALFRFEQDLHAARRRMGELGVETINKLWLGRQREMFGASVALSDDYGYWWSYISHFIHAPFYVYAYAFGELLTLALYACYRREGAAFVPRYLDMLSAGDAKSPKELLRPLGVDLRSAAFWRSGVSFIGTLVEETKLLWKQAAG